MSTTFFVGVVLYAVVIVHGFVGASGFYSRSRALENCMFVLHVLTGIAAVTLMVIGAE